jgi:hypothetical protein
MAKPTSDAGKAGTMIKAGAGAKGTKASGKDGLAPPAAVKTGKGGKAK